MVPTPAMAEQKEEIGAREEQETPAAVVHMQPKPKPSGKGKAKGKAKAKAKAASGTLDSFIKKKPARWYEQQSDEDIEETEEEGADKEPDNIEECDDDEVPAAQAASDGHDAGKHVKE